MSASSGAKKPFIPETYLDYPSQRLYSLSVWLLCQTIKLTDFLWYIASRTESLSLCAKWLIVDIILIGALAFLRIPRLTYSKATIALQMIAFILVDCFLFGGISLNGPSIFRSGSGASGGHPSEGSLFSTSPFSLLEYVAPYSFGLLHGSGSTRDGHLLGQHTVRMSPISTSQLNPQNLNFCLSSSSSFVLIPILLNNTDISGLRYGHGPLAPSPDGTRKFEDVTLSARELRSIAQTHRDVIQTARPSGLGTPHPIDDFDEYDDDDDEKDLSDPQSTLQKTQTLVYLRISRPGIIRLEQVVDSSNVEARISAADVIVVPCPKVSFLTQSHDPSGSDVQCAGQDTSRQLMINVYGVPPLSLRWWKTVNGNKEQYLVEGMEGEHGQHHSDVTSQVIHSSPTPHLSGRMISEPETLQIPLTVTLNNPGTYVYGLEEIVDGVGNVVRIGADTKTGSSIGVESASTTRSFMVVKQPAVSFMHCSSERPTSLLIGSEANLMVKSIDSDPNDGPWEIGLKYQPDTGNRDSKKHKPWSKTFTTQGERTDVSFSVNAPGEYTITGIKGKYCTGTVLVPNVCKVVERPLPSAEIEWKRIHECSGDTGVSASLILRGTPPFQVYYRIQRDNEAPREFSKTFPNSRGELTLQPERSGHYVFAFVSMSDANYRKVELQGPSIEQIIHPLASADFADSQVTGKNRKAISSCSGETIDIDVDLRGTGPWNLDVQVIGPQHSDIIHFEGIQTPRNTLQIPIPKGISQNGGSFEIDLVSVEDAYKCKRSISVPGVVVNVRRTRPSARFYGTEAERRVAVTENDQAKLPLRLTGDGPWRVRYRRTDIPEKILTARLFNPNDAISVSQQGVYEILEVADSQCPGTVVADASTYRVEWISRPTAKLSPETAATYVPYNNSQVLGTVCEGVSDHVDLDLIGRPPFQILYNIAQSNEQGGTRLLDQPTINSIQPRTRFQLHTSTPGRMFYEVKQIGDSVYPLEKYSNTVIPRSQRLLFEQQVAMRPSANFKNRNRLTYCLNDAFTSLDSSSTNGVVNLEGSPPFTLNLSIKNVAASQVKVLTVEVPSNIWEIDLPSYTFTSIGPHRISIDSVSDASNCAQSALDPLKTSIWVDVAETAAIIPFDNRQDLCVGEVSQFQLEGIPPWTVGYRVDGKSYTKEIKTSPFSIQQQQPGDFIVTSIAHQQKLCKAVVTDLRFNVHALPSAQVGHGKKIFQDIHEGDQAEIIFTLIGEPPFTFTYQRSEVTPKKSRKPGRILETHTVSRVMTHEYSIFSALEGTWTVTSISDKFCRYPPVQPELGQEKQKR